MLHCKSVKSHEKSGGHKCHKRAFNFDIFWPIAFPLAPWLLWLRQAETLDLRCLCPSHSVKVCRVLTCKYSWCSSSGVASDSWCMLELLEDYLKMLGSLFCGQVENHRHWKALQGIVHLLDPTPWNKISKTWLPGCGIPSNPFKSKVWSGTVPPHMSGHLVNVFLPIISKKLALAERPSRAEVNHQDAENWHARITVPKRPCCSWAWCSSSRANSTLQKKKPRAPDLGTPTPSTSGCS